MSGLILRYTKSPISKLVNLSTNTSTSKSTFSTFIENVGKQLAEGIRPDVSLGRDSLKKVVETYNSRDKLVFTSEVVADFINDLSDELIKIFRDLQEDKTSFEKLGITYEEKAFYDILKMLTQKYDFEYADEKLINLAKKVKVVVDDKTKYTDWSKRDDIKAELKVDLIILLAENDYPPIDRDEVYKEIFEQAENYKKYRG